MSMFYLYAAILVALAIAFVVFPWLGLQQKQAKEISNVNVIKQRIAEIEQEQQEGLIDEMSMRQAIDEMKLALVDEQVTVAEQGQFSRGSKSIMVLILGIIASLILGGWTYLQANQTKGLSELLFAKSNIDELNQRIVLKPAQDVTPQEFNQYALIIRQRLREQSDDVIGWQWLGRIRMTLGQLQESAAAFEKVLNVNPNDDATRTKYVEALMMSGDEESLDNALRQVQYLVSKAPDDRQYRLLLTVIAAQMGEAELAFSNFALIRDDLSKQSGFYDSLVAQLRAMGASDEILGQSRNTNVSGFELQVQIEAPLADKLPDEGFLIVFAQLADGSNRIPLAVKNIPMPTFPHTLSLSVEDAMLDSMKLSDGQLVNIIARISRDQDVSRQGGELQGIIEQVPVTDTLQELMIIINEEIE